MPTNKKHTITTINDIFDIVDEENIGRFLSDFNQLIGSFVMLKEQAKLNNIPIDSFRPHTTNWTDDNKPEITIKFEAKK